VIRSLIVFTTLLWVTPAYPTYDLCTRVLQLPYFLSPATLTHLMADTKRIQAVFPKGSGTGHWDADTYMAIGLRLLEAKPAPFTLQELGDSGTFQYYASHSDPRFGIHFALQLYGGMRGEEKVARYHEIYRHILDYRSKNPGVIRPPSLSAPPRDISAPLPTRPAPLLPTSSEVESAHARLVNLFPDGGKVDQGKFLVFLDSHFVNSVNLSPQQAMDLCDFFHTVEKYGSSTAVHNHASARSIERPRQYLDWISAFETKMTEIKRQK